MFYLKEFYQLIRRHFIIGPLLIISTIIFTGTFLIRNEIVQTIQKTFKTPEQYPYFNVIVLKRENISRISRRITSLPGVKQVKRVNKNDIEEKIKKLTEGLDLNESLSLIKSNYHGLKVIFNQKTSTTSQSLIREYINRLVGKKNIFIGPTLNTKKQKKIKGEPLLIKHAEIIVLLTVTLLLFISTIIFNNKAKEQSYYLEQFQRRKRVNVKIMLTGISTIIAPIIILTTYYDRGILFHLLIPISTIYLFTFIINLKKHSWTY